MPEVFESLIYPFDSDSFSKEIYQKKAVKINGGIGKSQLNFNWDSLNSLLNTKKIPLAKIKLFANGIPVPEPADHYAVLRHCINGGELIILDVEDHELQIRELCYSLADQLKSTIHSSLFISSPENYPRNYISQFYNTFVIQLAGRKKWQICSPIDQTQQNNSPKGAPVNLRHEPVPYLECQLQPLDILYIPARHYYKPENSEPSLHLGLIIKQHTGGDYLSWLVNNELVNDELFTRHFPLEYQENIKDGNWLSPSWKERLAELTASFKEKLADKNLIERYYEFLVKNQQGSVNYTFPFPFISEPVHDLQGVKLLRATYQDSIIKNNTEEKMINIFFWKQKLNYPEKYLNLVEYVFGRTEINGADLLALEAPLTKEEITEWVNDLIKRGILQLQPVV